MQSGIDFLRERVRNALSDHEQFLRVLSEEEAQAEDDRIRDLCAHFAPRAREHQRLLGEVQALVTGGHAEEESLAGDLAGLARRAVSAAAARATDLADAARPSEFERLVGLARQADVVEAEFRTFRDAGRTLGLVPLARIGELAERHHDDFARDAYRLVQQLFVERARGAEHVLGRGRLARPDIAG